MILIPRHRPSALWQVATPLLALLATAVAAALLFALRGVPPGAALYTIFVEPLLTDWQRPEILVKAAPLILIATGLAIGFRAGVWNIGAEGQFILGGLAGGAVALAAYPGGGPLLLPAMLAAGTAAGFAWAMIPALLRIRFGTSEILVSLMLVYVAVQLLEAMVAGPLRDPAGFNFPESRLFQPEAIVPTWPGTRAHLGVLAALVAALAAHVFLFRHEVGFKLRLMGEAPRAARLSGARPGALIALSLGLSGALAGLAGVFEVAGPFQQLTPGVPQGYGFTAIIVAFLGRLHPIGIVAAGLVLATTYIGGETAQQAHRLPRAAIELVQGMMLFFLLGFDLLARYRIRR